MLIGGSAKGARARQETGGFGTPGLLHLEAQREGDIYWTYTAWVSQAELDDFMQNNKTHNEAIQRSAEFGETTTKRWEVDGKLLSWKDANCASKYSTWRNIVLFF